MDSYSNYDKQIDKGLDEEYKETDNSTSLKVESEPENRRYEPSIMGSKKKKADEGETRNSATRSRSSSKKKKGNLFSLKLVFKILVIAAVCFNFKFIWNYMKEPIGNFTFYHSLFVLAVCSGINFAAVWVLFYKSSFKRFYLSLFAILGSVGYYGYVNYTNHSFLGNNMIPSFLVALSILIVINPKLNYYMKSIIYLLVSVIGIYLNGHTFALVWALMLSAGLILLFRVSNTKSKPKNNKKEDRASKRQKQSA